MTDQPEHDPKNPDPGLLERAHERALGKGPHKALLTELIEPGEFTVPAKGTGDGRSIEEIIEGHRQDYLATLVEVAWASHPVMPSAVQQRCNATDWGVGRHGSHPCAEHASHKLGEEGGNPLAHNLTAYVCCEHFRSIMGRCEP